jgi:hypothetical protein
LPVFGTFMDGVNIYKTTLPQEGVGHGQWSEWHFKELEALIKISVSIPRFGKSKNGKFKCSYSNRNCAEWISKVDSRDFLMKGEINQDGSSFRDWYYLSKGCQLIISN